MRFLHCIFIFIALLFLVSCGSKVVNPEVKAQDTITETLIKVNHYMIQQDHELIKRYAQRRNWNLKQNDEGLYYHFPGEMKGIKPSKGSKVTVEYRLELIDGSYCYSSDSSGVKDFIVGSRQVEKGLDDGISMVSLGEEAFFIIPPHLAHGLTGDGNQIPPRAIIVYRVKLLSIENDMI